MRDEKNNRMFMARPGVTYNDVAKAAIEISAKGTLPTIDNVRLLLGTGSTSTIAPHLRTWKSKQNDTLLIASKEKLPEDFVALMKGLWDRVLQEAQTQVSVIEQNADKNLSEHKQQIDRLTQENKQLQQHYNQLLQKEQKLTNDKLILEQAVIRFQNEQAVLQTEIKSFHQRLADKQERIDELQRLNQQVQNNLDRYREASREQRLKEQQQYETQIKHLEQSVQQYLQENKYFKNQLQVNQGQLGRLQNNHQILKNDHHTIIAKMNSLKSHLTTTQDTLINSQKNEELWKSRYQDSIIQIDNQKTSISNLQNQVNLFSQQLLNAQDHIDKISKQNQLLVHEKWELGQETAQLKGKLKQFEIRI